MVIRSSNLIPEMALAHFQCSVCRYTADVEIEQVGILLELVFPQLLHYYSAPTDSPTLTAPLRAVSPSPPSAPTARPITASPSSTTAPSSQTSRWSSCRSVFVQCLYSYLLRHLDPDLPEQESPDDMPAGQTPHTVVLYVHGDLVDSVQPGDRSVLSLFVIFPI